MSDVHLKYLAVTPADLLWGTAVNSVGMQEIASGTEYPPTNHPPRYIFNFDNGRILHEYQLIYITEGRGKFYCETLGRNRGISIGSGMVFLLFPGEWHSYRPDPQTGWKEYWIGFNSAFMKNLIDNGFFAKDKPVFMVNIHEDLVALYNEAIAAAERQESGFQQLLAGIVMRLVSLVYFYDKNQQYEKSDIADKVAQAKVIIQENYSDISPEEIASKLCLSYSTFRKTFKEYTGFSPARYIGEVRMSKAKELLTNTSLSIKEVAYHVGYNNHDYFFTAFRHVTGKTPAEYRTMTQGTNL